YKAEHDEDEAALRHARVMLQAKVKALAAARMPSSALAKVVIPATGRRKGEYQLHHLLGVEEHQTTWEYGRTTGHIGGGDLAAGLAHLVETEAVGPGDRVLLFGGGSGFTCTTALLEITEVPQWT
ncbi:3-oxoacyl-[acyl-carrier-protein] synthase III C-terminal domain-containing protein, partial [Streptomyces sp. MCAF7]